MQLRDYQTDAVERLRASFRAGKRAPLLVAPTGCHARGQRVLMFDGSLRAVEDVDVGDRLMGSDSTPRTVTRLCRGAGEMYRVLPTKGAPFDVNGDHVLSLVDTCSGEITDVSVNDWMAWSKTQKHRAKLFRVPVDFMAGGELPISAYFLGVL